MVFMRVHDLCLYTSSLEGLRDYDGDAVLLIHTRYLPILNPHHYLIIRSCCIAQL